MIQNKKYFIKSKLLLILLVSFCVSCSSFPPIKEKIEFSDINGIWESTGYLHYMKIHFVSHKESSLILINDSFETEKYFINREFEI